MVSREGGTVFTSKESPSLKEIVGKSILNHVLIIPDNNRTWANANGLSTRDGYNEGAKRIVETAQSALFVPDLDFLTVHLVSKDNLEKREGNELVNLWDAVRENMLDTELPELAQSQNVRLRVLGDMSGIPKDVQENFDRLVGQSRRNTGKSLSFVIGYDKEQEMDDAHKAAKSAGIDTSDWSQVKQYLYLPSQGLPEVSAIVRTGGEKRTSGIFPYSIADAEHVYYDKATWPEFTHTAFVEVVGGLSQRKAKGGA